MTNFRCEAETRRLRLVGAVGDADLADLEERVRAFADVAEGVLVIDLTAVTDLADSAARYLVDVKEAAAADGRQMTLLRRCGTATDDALNGAADPPRG
jgi:anti-anti-sigma regulatory factor